MSRPLAVAVATRVAKRLRAIEDWGRMGDLPAVRNALPALARLVEWADVQASGDPYDNDRVSLNAVLRDVAAALGINEAQPKEKP